MSGIEILAAGTLGQGVGAVTLADVLVAGGALTAAAGAVGQGVAANRAAKFESQQLNIQAERDRQISRQQAEDFANNESRRQASLRARVAGSGATLEGSPLAVVSDLAAETEFQRLRILAGGEAAASRATSQAGIRRFEGRSSRGAGFTRAGATLLTGAGKVFS